MSIKKKYLDLVKKHGSPIYIYDANFISMNIDKLKSAFQNIDMSIYYACKANSHNELLTYLKNKGLGVDTVSREEASYCLELGFEPSKILYTPSFPSVEDLVWAINTGLKVHLNSIEYIPLLASELSDIKIGIRINPEVEKDGNPKIDTGHADSKFGVPISHINELLDMMERYNVKINALHLHPGSDVSDWRKMVVSADKVIDLAPLFPDLEYIDLGSGFKVKFKKGDKEVDIVSYANHIKDKIKQLDKNIKIIIEPGKYLVSQAGVFIAKVELVKRGVKTNFAGVNTGFNHLIRPMYYGAYHEIVNLSNTEGNQELYDIVGYLCEEDTFAYNRSINKIHRGDFLLFQNAGAYGYSMSSDYNRRVKPKELFLP